MTTLSWCIFVPLITAGIILLPVWPRSLVKAISVLGAALTFVIAMRLTMGYKDASTNLDRALLIPNAREYLATVQERVIASADFGPAYSEPEGIARWKTDFLTPRVDAAGKPRLERPANWDSLSPAAQDAWSEAAELQLAMEVRQAEHLRYIEYIPWIEQFHVNYFVEPMASACLSSG